MRLVTRRGLAVWIWHRSGSIGRVLIAVGLLFVVLGVAQGESSAGTSLILLGGVMLMVGTWMILPGREATRYSQRTRLNSANSASDTASINPSAHRYPSGQCSSGM